MSYIKLESITKEYKYGENYIKALDEISFEIEKGELVVILGKSGAGKSTLLNILGGMDKASSGKYFLNEKEITAFNLHQLSGFRKSDIGFVFQFYNLMPNLNAIENVMLSTHKCREIASSKEALEMVGLKGRLYNFPSQLSGGEQQRVSIARALVKNPQLLLCDEPTGALDSKTGQQIIELLVEMAHVRHNTVIIVTHNAALSQIADRVIRINDGKIIENYLQDNPLKVSDVQW